MVRPVGTIENVIQFHFQSSLRDENVPFLPRDPSDKSLGYGQTSLRDDIRREAKSAVMPAGVLTIDGSQGDGGG